ncbi:MAG: hypothetical protein RL208_504 [Pseudomonadota bacterium]|jgi:hypothetical protein
MNKKILLIAYFLFLIRAELKAAQVTSIKGENIPDFPKDYQSQQVMQDDNDLNLTDFGRRYDNFISSSDGYELHNSVISGNDDIVYGKDRSIQVDYSHSAKTRTRIMANTMLIMLDNPDYLSNDIYSYFIINDDLK